LISLDCLAIVQDGYAKKMYECLLIRMVGLFLAKVKIRSQNLAYNLTRYHPPAA